MGVIFAVEGSALSDKNTTMATVSLGRWPGAVCLCLLWSLLAGCTETAPVRSGEANGAAATSSEDEASAATAEVQEDEPLPWPPPNGDIPQPQEAAATGKMFEWKGDGRRLSRIIIDTDRQQASFYDGDELVGWSTVATGVASHRTPTGEFEVMEKVADKRSNLYGRIYDSAGNLVKRNAKQGRDAVPPGGRFVGARMPHFLRMTYDGVGMHAGPIPRPGNPASHGCIRMPAQVADAIFDHADLGTRVTVVGSSGPDYGDYAERVRAREAERRAQDAAAETRRQGDGLGGPDAEIAAVAAGRRPAQAVAAPRTAAGASAEASGSGESAEPSSTAPRTSAGSRTEAETAAASSAARRPTDTTTAGQHEGDSDSAPRARVADPSGADSSPRSLSLAPTLPDPATAATE